MIHPGASGVRTVTSLPRKRNVQHAWYPTAVTVIRLLNVGLVKRDTERLLTKQLASWFLRTAGMWLTLENVWNVRMAMDLTKTGHVDHV